MQPPLELALPGQRRQLIQVVEYQDFEPAVLQSLAMGSDDVSGVSGTGARVMKKQHRIGTSRHDAGF
jgi:hypothetical protein